MTTTADTPGRHPVADFAERLEDRLEQLSRVAIWSMKDDELRDTLVLLTRDQTRLEAVRLQVLAEADRRDATAIGGAPDPAAYVAAQTLQTRPAARSDLKLARALEDHQPLAHAVAAGRANPAQARVILRALDTLPATGAFAVDTDQRLLAEQHLIELAEHHDAAELRILGRRLFEVVAPDLADAYEGRLLAEEEAGAARRTRFEMWEAADGTAHGRFRIPARHAAMLRKAIQALTNPSRLGTTAGSPVDADLPTVVRDGVALTHIIEALQAHWLPTHGGTGATVVVTMTLEQLRHELVASGVCTTDTGHRITAGEARRLACTAGIIPVVLGGGSVILDAGTMRYFTRTQRTVMGIRDGGCTAVGCDVPASMCHAHHDIPWAASHQTSIKRGRLLCGHHHRRLHDPAYRHEIGPDNKVTFHRRT